MDMYVLVVALVTGDVNILPFKSKEHCEEAMSNFVKEIPKGKLDYIECQKAEVTQVK